MVDGSLLPSFRGSISEHGICSVHGSKCRHDAGFLGIGGYEIGPMMIERHEKSAIPISEWGGNGFI